MIKQIIYIGVTISKNGLNGRLSQFELAMRSPKRNIHGGAERVKYKHRDLNVFFKHAYVSAKIFDISSVKSEAERLRIKGKCLGKEYESIAEYLDINKVLPEFNDPESPKSK